MNKKTIIIYHKADFDGIFCREIAKKFIPDATLIGWDYGDPVPTPDVCSSEDRLYMLDISIESLMGHPRLIWIDHHKSAIEKYPSSIVGYRIDGVAACRLTWQWFKTHEHAVNSGYNNPIVVVPGMLAEKAQFIERTIEEPLAVRLAGEYDIWDKRDPNAELFQHGLRSQELTENMWDLLLADSTEPVDGKKGIGEITVEALLENGRAIQFAKSEENASVINSNGFTLHWEGLTFLACNAARYNSFLFTAGIRPEHDALLGFNWDGTKWKTSLYHAPGKEHHDLSLIASKYGGGGHRGACGFSSPKLVFTMA